MYMCAFETPLQVYLVDPFESIFNVLYFSIFNHTYCGKHNVLVYGIQESNAVDVHDMCSNEFRNWDIL